ncbi:MAG TPA: protein kinase [Leptolyngbya sp.]|nr:protein kinase [Leptolyngbya sp.]
MKLQTGATLQSGKYRLSQVLGRESLGATYLATQTLLHQTVVIKTIDPSLQITQSFPQLRLRFIEETRLLARCQHPSIVRVLDFFQEDGLPFLVMEYIPGQTLYDRVATQNAPTLTEAEAIHYLRQAASALSIAHRHGLIHRNIRPETIVRRQGTNLGILVGFGLAHDVAVSNPIATNPFLPQDPNWGRDNRFAIDFYALAATLYYLLTKQAPDGEISLEQYAWSPATKQAILQGLTRDPHHSQGQLQTVDDWLRLLPNTTLPLMAANTIAQTQNGATPVVTSPPASNGRSLIPVQNGQPIPPTAAKIPVEQPDPVTLPIKLPPVRSTPVPSASVPSASVPIESAASSRRLPKSLTLTIAAAGAIGLGFGLALRISAARSPDTTLLQPVQPFAEKEWKGTINPSSNHLSDTPIESGKPNATTTPRKFGDSVDSEVAQPSSPPKVETPEPEYIPPVQPRVRRSPAIIAPSVPVKPAPEPIDTPPEPIAPIKPAVSHIAPPSDAPAPLPPKTTTREVAPLPPLNSTP